MTGSLGREEESGVSVLDLLDADQLSSNVKVARKLEDSVLFALLAALLLLTGCFQSGVGLGMGTGLVGDQWIWDSVPI